MNILFNDLPILEETKQAIQALGLVETTDIQHHTIFKMLEKKDLIGQAQTGTGKTFAFAIPMIEHIDPKNKNIQGLVICPTRELTLQVYKEFLKLIKFNKDIRITSIYGGESYQKQFKALANHPHIVVATPGRAIDHLNRKTMDLSNLNMLIMDEADEMLKMGFQDDLETLLKDTPQDRQTALFSATIPAFIKEVAKKYQKTPDIIKIKTESLTVDKIEQFYYMIKKSDRDQLLLRVLDYYNPSSAIIFANTKKDVDHIAAFLQKYQFEADALHGDLKQSQRDYVMNRFRSRQLTLLVATDVAARGLDISHVDVVFNYELPFEDEIYVHRIGRTGRAGESGKSISFVYPSMRGKLMMIERYIKLKMVELEIPSLLEIKQKQDEVLIETVKHYTDSKTQDYSDMINNLINEGYDKDDIISALVERLSKQTKAYEDISKPRTKQDSFEQKTSRSTNNRRDRNSNSRDQRSSNRGRDSKRSQDNTYYTAVMNVGKNDGLRAPHLIDYLKKNADMYPKNIGDINIKDDQTEFQIHIKAVKRLDQVNDKIFKGRKLKFKITK
ncbi:MAG: DEAD/DEAH box helicase [Acholeplasmataceae bacterium]